MVQVYAALAVDASLSSEARARGGHYIVEDRAGRVPSPRIASLIRAVSVRATIRSVRVHPRWLSQQPAMAQRATMLPNNELKLTKPGQLRSFAA
jgi:hypothetical protein